MTAQQPNIVLIPSTYTKNNIRINVTLPSGITASAVQRQIMFTKANLFGTTEKEVNIWHNWTANAFATENQTVYARYAFKTDTTVNGVEYKTGDTSEIKEYQITTIDKEAPLIEFISKDTGVTIIENTTSADTVEITVTDNESGLDTAGYYYMQNDSEMGIIDISNTVTVLDKTIYRVVATDNVGNISEKSLKLVEKPAIITEPVVENEAIYNFNVIINSLTENVNLKVNEEKKILPCVLECVKGEAIKYEIELYDIYGSKDTMCFTLFEEAEDIIKPNCITIFNAVLNKEKRSKEYISTKIEGVNIYAKKVSNLTNNGLISANDYKIRIPKNALCDKKYIEPYLYKDCDKNTFYTVQKGDFIFLGLTDKKINKISDKITVTSVTDNRHGNLSHIAIGGV